MKLLKYLLLMILNFICFVPNSIADDGSMNFSISAEEQKVVEKYQRDQTAHYKAFLEKEAKEGKLRAQVALGEAYKNGLFGKSILKAIKWYTLAANRGDVSAQYNLGRIYADGNGRPVNYIKARKWFIKAAEQGDSLAKISLAFMYKDGREGIPKDRGKADGYAKQVCSDIDYTRIGFIHPNSLEGQCLMYNDFKQ